jgi:hypothetical protein
MSSLLGRQTMPNPQFGDFATAIRFGLDRYASEPGPLVHGLGTSAAASRFIVPNPAWFPLPL